MNAGRQVLRDGAVAIKADKIVAIGKREDIAAAVSAKQTHDARGFVMTPGFIDGHIHITGDPLTRGFARGAPGEPPSAIMSRWVIPIFRTHSPSDEAISAQCAALSMMRHGTTCFLEAGTITHLDAVMEGLSTTGIRGRTGEWVEGRAYDPAEDQEKKSADAIKVLESEVARYPDKNDAKLAAWPVLVGHSTNSDDVWKAAKSLADTHNIRVSAHMSPRASDPEWFLAKYNRRPLEHLNDIGVLGDNVCITHLANIDGSELDVLVETGTNAILCAHAAMQGGFGLSQHGLFPEMIARGVNVMMGTDGLAADILGAARLMAYLFRDARADQKIFPATMILELATLHGARAMGMTQNIGSLEVGKKADLVLHDTNLPEWGPIFDPVLQLALSAPLGAVHSVWIDGVRVIADGRATLIDEEKLLVDARQAGAQIIARTKLPVQTPWPIL
ncbi:MAG: amidohydrolase family protein [Proteobacteria bacterium]|nr:amidohydrolase family protein [Pseudomonadota bacterium]